MIYLFMAAYIVIGHCFAVLTSKAMEDQKGRQLPVWVFVITIFLWPVLVLLGIVMLALRKME